MADLRDLPSNVAVPQDDGAADHLVGRAAPDVALSSTSGDSVALGLLGHGRTVIYIYPLTGRPGVDLPSGWTDIPGARGCTTEACDFRDHYGDLLDAGADRVFGVSSQDSDYQRELVERLGLPFALLSDPQQNLAEALDLPTFEVDGTTLFKRMTLVIHDGLIEHTFYPVFPPNEHAQQVLNWLRARGAHADLRRDSWLISTWGWVSSQLPPAPATVLEIGCGTEGGFVPRMREAGYDAVGVDPMAPAGPDYCQLAFERLELGRQVDVVVACTSLHHVGGLEDVVSRIAGALLDGGTLVVVEWDWELFDEATARWCFHRLDLVPTGAEHGWLHHRRDAWTDSGETWAVHLRTWARQAGLHTADSMLRALDARFHRRSVTRAPYFFPYLEQTTESDEQAAVDGGLVQATGLRYVAHLPSV